MMDSGAEYTYVDSNTIKPFYGNTGQSGHTGEYGNEYGNTAPGSFGDSMLYELKKFQANRNNHNQMEGYNNSGHNNTGFDNTGFENTGFDNTGFDPPGGFDQTNGYAHMGGGGHMSGGGHIGQGGHIRGGGHITEGGQTGRWDDYRDYRDGGFVNNVGPQNDHMYSNTMPGNTETFIPVEDNYMEPSPSPGTNSQATYGNYIESSSTKGPYFAYGNQHRVDEPEKKDDFCCNKCCVIAVVIVILLLLGAAAVAYFVSRAFLEDSDERG